MSRRPAIATETEVKRMIRAAQSAGLTVVRIVHRLDGVAIETDAAPVPETSTPEKPVPVL